MKFELRPQPAVIDQEFIDALKLDIQNNATAVQTIQKHKKAPQFCSDCCMPTASDPETGLSTCCKETIISRSKAYIEATRRQAAMTRHLRQSVTAMARAFAEKDEAKKVKAKRPVRVPKNKNAEGAIEIGFEDSSLVHTEPDGKKARKWLRRHGLSVNDAHKAGNLWTLPEVPKDWAVSGSARDENLNNIDVHPELVKEEEE